MEETTRNPKRLYFLIINEASQLDAIELSVPLGQRISWDLIRANATVKVLKDLEVSKETLSKTEIAKREAEYVRAEVARLAMERTHATIYVESDIFEMGTSTVYGKMNHLQKIREIPYSVFFVTNVAGVFTQTLRMLVRADQEIRSCNPMAQLLAGNLTGQPLNPFNLEELRKD